MRAPGRTAARRRALLAILAALALHHPAGAQPGQSGSASEPFGEELILTVRSNGLERGEMTVIRSPDGDFWIRARDLPRLQVEAAPSSAARRVGDETYLSARSLGAASVVLDEENLSVTLAFPARTLEGTRIDLSAKLPPVPAAPPRNSLILNYRLSRRDSETALENEFNARLGRFLLRQETYWSSGRARRFTRGPSQLIFDDRINARRLTAGDVVSSAGAFGTAITGGGVLLAKLYDLDPDLVRQPTAHLKTASSLPADVEVAVDGRPVFRTHVGPGPIALDNLFVYGGGTRTLRVTVTDVTGRTEVIEQPFLFTDAVLAKGLHEYSYFLGKRSELGTTGTWRYKEPAWQAFHRYGLTDTVTIGAGGEGSRDFLNAGAGLTLRDSRLGLLAVELLTSADRTRSARANGWSTRYTYFGQEGSFAIGHRRFADGFRSFATAYASPFLRQETRVTLSRRLRVGNVAAELVRSVDSVERRLARVVRYSTTLGQHLTLNADYESNRWSGRPGWAVNVFLRWDLGGQRWVGSSARATASSRGFDIETGKQLAQGEGLGYRAGVSSNSYGGHGSAAAFLAANWNLRPATLEFFGSSQVRGGSSRHTEAAVSGALVAVDGSWGLTRKVNDSFVLARLGVPQEGVEVSVNNQAQGRTGKDGALFIPQVGAFGRQDVSVNDKEVGLEYNLRERRRIIAPEYRSGTVVDFGARKVRAIAGMAWQIRDGRRVPLASTALELTGPKGTVTIETSSAGDFYVEDASPGVYVGMLTDSDGRARSCSLTVPQSTSIVEELEEGIVCE